MWQESNGAASFLMGVDSPFDVTASAPLQEEPRRAMLPAMLSRRFPALTAATLVGFFATAVLARPDAQVRVRGGTRLEATATANDAGTQISGLVRDDAGRPVRDARLRVRWLTAAGPRLLPRPTPCGAGARPVAPSETEEAIAETDSSGHFCLHWPLELPDGNLSLSYEDERGLLDSVSRSVELDRKPPLELAFSPPPSTFSADTGNATVVVEARGPGVASLANTPLILEWVRVDKTTTELARGELHANEATRLSFSVTPLGTASGGELVAWADVAGRRLECRTPVALTARVTLDSAPELAARADGSAELSVRVGSVFGKVPSGSVEAIARGRTIGIAPVTSGLAELELRAPSEPGPLSVSLHYLSAAPWWLPDDERVISLLVARPNPWRWAPWALGLFAIGAYLLASWRRPRRRELPKPERPDPPQDRAALEWAAPPRGSTGWAGRVTDAHDGAPIRDAHIAVFASERLLAETASDAQGEFALSLDGMDLRLAQIRIEAVWHSPIEKPLPPPGKLAISLLTRRRALLAALVDWAKRQERPFAAEREPTPREVGEFAVESAQPAIANWARSVEDAAFGPKPVDADREAGVRENEPKR